MGPGDLMTVLAPLARQSDPRLLVGHESFDDAGVVRISDELALVQTVDFFAPVVDDPFTFGQVAAGLAEALRFRLCRVQVALTARLDEKEEALERSAVAAQDAAQVLVHEQTDVEGMRVIMGYQTRASRHSARKRAKRRSRICSSTDDFRQSSSRRCSSPFGKLSATGAVRTTTSDVDGGFRLAGLPTGRYTVDVTLSGFAPLKDVYKTDVYRLSRHLNDRAGREHDLHQLDGRWIPRRREVAAHVPRLRIAPRRLVGAPQRAMPLGFSVGQQGRRLTQARHLRTAGGAAGQMTLEAGSLDVVDRVQRVGAEQLLDLLVGRPGHWSDPIPVACSSWRSRRSPARMRLFTVPSGVTLRFIGSNIPVIMSFRDVVINVAHLAEQFEPVLGAGSRYGVSIRYSREGD